jgi:hypothetical protein
MDDTVVVRLHAVVISSRTGLNKPEARDLVKPRHAAHARDFWLAEV